MTGNAGMIDGDVFKRVADLHCRRWAARSLDAVRALLVGGERPSEIAERLDMKPQQVVELRRRFLELLKRDVAVKVPATRFMQTVPPDREALELFRNEIKILVQNGYTEEQIRDFLHTNNVDVTADQIKTFLGAMHDHNRTR